MSYKKWTGKLVVALLCFAASSMVRASPAPITLEANYLQYNDETVKQAEVAMRLIA